MGFNLDGILSELNVVPHGGFGSLMAVIGSTSVEVNTLTVHGQLNALRKSSVVQTAIQKRANAFSNLDIWAKDDKGKKITNPTVKADLAILQSPNPYQTFRTFNNMIETYASVFGKCYVYKSKLFGINKFEYYVIPNNMVEPEYYSSDNTDTFQKKVKQYKVKLYGNKELILQPKEVTELYDNHFGMYGEGLGASRLIGLSEAISTLLAIGETTTQFITDGGARGIIGQGASDVDSFAAPLLNREKKHIQEELSKYGSLRGQFKYIVTAGAINYVPLTSKISDMELPALAMDAKITIFERYGLPNIFAARETRYKSLPEARKEFYTATIIPEATDRFKAIVKMMGIPDREWEYKPDWSHMDFFQESLKESAIALQQASGAVIPLVDKGIITKEEAKSILEPYLE